MTRAVVSRRDTPIGNDIIHARVATKRVDLQFREPGRKAAGSHAVHVERDCSVIGSYLRGVKTTVCHNYKLAWDYRLGAVTLSANFAKGWRSNED
jgi:hypothetical protein